MDTLAAVQPTVSAWLDVVAGPAAGQRLPLDGEVRFGRDEPGPGALNGDRWLSPMQARLRRGAGGQYELEDLGSIEPTRVNGRAVRGPCALNYGDVIELGSSRLVISEPAVLQSPVPRAALPESATQVPYTAAPDGRRFVAFVIDAAIEVGVAYGAYTAFLSSVIERGTNVAIALLAFLFACQLTYRFLCESLWGQTLGKHLLGICVVRVDRRPLDPNAALVRALLMPVEGFLLIGPIAMILTGRTARRRLGDLAAGTIVVPAPAPHSGFARRTRDRLMLASPIVWCATIAIVLNVLGPGLESCSDAGVTPPVAREGSCIQNVDGVLAEVVAVDAGHTLRMPTYSVALERSAIGAGGPDGSTGSFKLSVTNTGTMPLAFNADSEAVKLALSDGTLLSEPSDPTTGPSFDPTLYPGQTATGWVAFSIPLDETGTLTEQSSDLTFPMISSDRPYLGEMRLWKVRGAAGEQAVRGLGQ